MRYFAIAATLVLAAGCSAPAPTEGMPDEQPVGPQSGEAVFRMDGTSALGGTILTPFGGYVGEERAGINVSTLIDANEQAVRVRGNLTWNPTLPSGDTFVIFFLVKYDGEFEFPTPWSLSNAGGGARSPAPFDFDLQPFLGHDIAIVVQQYYGTSHYDPTAGYYAANFRLPEDFQVDGVLTSGF